MTDCMVPRGPDGGGAWSDQPLNEHLTVRHTANLHTGGTIRDVTDELNPKLARVAIDAADAIGIPVTRNYRLTRNLLSAGRGW